MSQISLKSISGITSITTPAGVDNQLTVHTNDTTEKLKVTTSGLNVTGVVTATNFVKADGSSVGNTVNNNANNRVITGSDSANTLEGEANLTFDGDNLTITGSNHVTQILKAGGATSDLHIDFKDSSNNLEARIFCASDQGDLRFYTGGANERIRIDSSGRVMIGTTTEGQGNADEFTISFNNTGVSGGDQGRCGMTIRSGDNTSGVTQPGYIYFSDGTSGDNESKGVVAYDHNADEMYLSSDGVKAFGLNSSGYLHLGRDYSTNPQNGLVGITTIRGHRVNEAGDYAQLYFKNSSSSGNSSASMRAFRDGSNYSTGLSFYTHSSNSSGGDGTEKLRISKEGTITHLAVTAFQIAKGTTAQRPSGVDGMIRFNTELSQTEEYRDGGWKGLSNKTAVTGGTTTTSGSYTIHTFTSSGTLTVSGGTKSGVDYLLVAGGGGGGNSRAGGGGGGGMTVTTGATLAEGSYTITVGAGGGGSTSFGLPGASGNTTSLGGVASVVGGGGGGGGGGASDRPGLSGGSGGGGSDGYSGGAGTSGQGSNGGGSSGSSGGGGGGGKGGVGNNGDTDSGNNFVDNNSGGNGGNGGSNNYSGSNQTYGAGGGGGSRDDGPYGAGVHGGGNGGQNNSNVATAGSTNQGGGGGGGARLHGSNTSTFYGANGGSGIVIIRYLT